MKSNTKVSINYASQYLQVYFLCSSTYLPGAISVFGYFAMQYVFSRAVQAERLIWSLWCLYVCM